jgi:hypothetical protein
LGDDAFGGIDQWQTILNDHAGLRKIRLEDEILSGALNRQFGSWSEVQVVAKLLGNDNAADFVDFNGGSHNGIDSTSENGILMELRSWPSHVF